MEQIGRLDPHSWEKKENPQTYMLMPSYGENPRPSQHMLGIVGGNEVPYLNRQLQVEPLWWSTLAPMPAKHIPNGGCVRYFTQRDG